MLFQILQVLMGTNLIQVGRQDYDNYPEQNKKRKIQLWVFELIIYAQAQLLSELNPAVYLPLPTAVLIPLRF